MAKSRGLQCCDDKISQIRIELINYTPLTSQDRKYLPLHQVNVDFIEAKYETVIADLPKKIDKARAVMNEDTVVRNMLGYTIALSFILGATLETAGCVLMQFRSLQEALTQISSTLQHFSGLWYTWWYGAGDWGPWFFPDALGTGGDPNLKCSSEDFIRLVRKYNLHAGVASISRKKEIERFVLLERLEKDLSEDLGCILYPSYPKRIFKEHEEVILQVQELLGLLRFHRGLIGEPGEDSREEELSFLDQEISSTWKELSLAIEEVSHLLSPLNTSYLQSFFILSGV